MKSLLKRKLRAFLKTGNYPPEKVFLLLTRSLWYGPMGVFIAIPVAETLIALAAWIVFRRGK
jgi:hypothetical protein